MNKSIVSMLMAAVTGLQIAAVCAADIDRVIVRQQWPWSTDVRVEYELSGVDAAQPVDITVRAYNGETELVLPNSAIRGERFAITTGGVRELFIDPVAAFGSASVSIPDFKVKLTTNNSPADINEVLYKVFDLATSTHEDITRADILNGKKGSFETDFLKIGGNVSREILVWTEVTNDIAYATTKLVMRRIKGAGQTVTMGSPSDEVGRETDGRETQHNVTLANEDYFIGVFPLTIGQVANSKYMYSKSGGSITLNSGTVIYTTATWNTAEGEEQDACPIPLTYPYQAMRGKPTADNGVYDWPTGTSVQNGTYMAMMNKWTGVDFNLPTEAQWEFACRGGTVTGLNNGQNLTSATGGGNVKSLAWTAENANGTLHRVGQRLPNAYGLYDMHGSVLECCIDYYTADVSSLPTTDVGGPTSRPATAASGHVRVLKGGGYKYAANTVRSGWRRNWVENASITDQLGVRLVCPAE